MPVSRSALELGLAAEVFQPGVLRRVGNAHVHHTLHTRSSCRIEQDRRVAYGSGVREVSVVEPDPVRVVQGRHASERLGQLVGPAEVERAYFNGVAEGMAAMGRVGERPDFVVPVQQSPGDVFPGVAERTGDGIDLISRHAHAPRSAGRLAPCGRVNRMQCIMCGPDAPARTPPAYIDTQLGRPVG